ncbi:MAG: hypothetical protein APF76_05255 [Desulfitibacter sp. BRH_c19]|nr:MAG: hypothetical protein APF76_05255 [Desulfitibacter sp. BRH_c19]
MKVKYYNGLILFIIIIVLVLVGVTAGNPLSHVSAIALGERELNWGSRGEDVAELQRMLDEKGFDAGRIDGIYGPRTASAVRKFQLSRGLTGTGIANIATIDRLDNPTKRVAAAVENAPALSSDEMLLLARTIHSEARGEPYEGQVAVAAVVVNRVKHPSFPNSIPDVIFQPGAFTAVSDGQIWLEPNASAFRAATDALSGWDPSNGAIYYWNPAVATSRWIWSRPIHRRIGKHVFGT